MEQARWVAPALAGGRRRGDPFPEIAVGRQIALDAHGAGDAVKALRSAVAGLVAQPATVTTMTPLPAGTTEQGQL